MAFDPNDDNNEESESIVIESTPFPAAKLISLFRIANVS